jgi:hypothetical protein
MKTKLSSLLLILALSPALTALCQVPQGFNYQAIARDGVTGNPITDPIDVKIAILSDDDPVTVLWEEIHYGVNPDDNGLFNLTVGKGTTIAGLAGFNLIDWTVIPKYIRTKIIYGGEKDMGSAQLWSVPYAMVADSLGGPLKKLSVEGNTLNMDEPLFEVKNTGGKTVFAVYNEGVRVYVDNNGEVKGTKGGFAVSGFGDTKAPSQNYLFVSGDSIRAYIGPVPTGGKTSKGGFAVGGFDGTKDGTGEYLRVTRDSTRVYVNENAKTIKGGFAVGGFAGAKAIPDNYLNLTPDNYFIGHRSGRSVTTGTYNSFFGFEAGEKTKSGSENIFIGYQSGLENILGKWNTVIGYQAGMTNGGSDNTFIGYKAGRAHETKGGNVYIGSKAGEFATSGEQNVLIGESVGANITTGSKNIMLGVEAGNNTSIGQSNVFIGYSAGKTNTSGLSNIFIGTSSGINNISGQDNVFMGTEAGFSNSLGCYNVFIGHSAGYKNIGTGPTEFPGNFNVFLGYATGYFNETGQSNVFLGKQSGFKNVSGNANTFIGMNTGAQLTASSSNVFIGTQAGTSKTGGDDNTFIGSYAGMSNGTGASNVFIGFKAGFAETGSSLLYIENSDSDLPLIGGDFAADKVAINGKPDPGGATLQLNGSLRVGNNGSNINNIIKVTISKDLPSIAAGTSYTDTFSVPNTFISGSVSVSPQSGLTDGLVISYARVSTNGTVEVKFRNNSAGTIDMGPMNWHIAVIQ